MLAIRQTHSMDTANPGRREDADLSPPEQHRMGRRPADTFSNRLILTIRLTGLSIRDFAEGAGLDDGSVSNWTRGMRPRDMPGVCHAIAVAYDIDRDWLMWGGPLLSSRGLPTKRTGGATWRSHHLPVRPATPRTDRRPPTSPLAGSPNRADRRPRLIDNSRPVGV